MILVDTSGLLAALFPDQRHHSECARILREAEAPRVLSPFVLAEADYLILKYGGVQTELLFLDEIARGAYEVSPFNAADVGSARKVIERYSDLKLGIADASIVVLAEVYGTRDVLTLDERHFRSVRVARKSFRVLPFDA